MRILKNRSIRILTLVVFAAGCWTIMGCAPKKKGADGKDGGRKFIDIGTSPPGGVFNPVGTAIADSLNENKGENDWKIQAKGTKGSQENIRLLDSGDIQLAVSNSAISHFAHEGKGTWDKKYDIRTVVTLAPNVALFVTKKDSGIKSVADLKGKKVVCGPPGAGFEMFVGPIIEAHGVTFDDFDKSNAGQNDAVDMLADGQADAAFLGGAIPAPSIARFCNEQDVYFVPWNVAALEKLAKDFAFFWPVNIPQDKYRDLESDYAGMNVGSMHLITTADQDEEAIYQITKMLWENRSEIGHPVPKKFINEKNAARFTGTPFHPGAVKFYKEIGIWPEGQ